MKRTCRNVAREVCAGKTAATNRAGKIAVRPLVLSAFMGAVSAVLMAMEFPVPLAPGFVKMDFSDLPVILGGFIMGPLAGMRIIAVKIGLSFLLKGTVTMGVGELANMIGSVSYMLPAVLLYRRWHTRRGAVLSLAAATACAAASALIYNLFLIFPVYARLYGMSMDSIVAMARATSPWVTDLFSMMLLSMLPFNLFKYASVSVIAFFVYKRLRRLLKGWSD